MPSDGMLQAMASAIPVQFQQFPSPYMLGLGLLVLILQLCLKPSMVNVKVQHRVHNTS